ncbi:MAG TPA: SH3 domain-containing protein [Clostridium sp.]
MLTIGTQIDDTVWATSTKGTLYITDTGNNTIYSVTGTFKKGTAFVAAPNDSGVGGFVGTADLTTGLITPFVSGVNSPHGLLFVPQLPEVTPSTEYKNQYGVATGDGISIRTGAGTQYSWQGSFALRTKINILGTAGSFYKVRYSGITGYVSNQYIKTTAK